MRCVDSVVELAASDHFHQLSIKANPTFMYPRESYLKTAGTLIYKRPSRTSSSMQSLFRLPVASFARMTGQPALFTSGIDMKSVWFVAF